MSKESFYKNHKYRKLLLSRTSMFSVVYKLQDYERATESVFYHQEVQRVGKPDVFSVEKVLRSKGMLAREVIDAEHGVECVNNERKHYKFVLICGLFIIVNRKSVNIFIFYCNYYYSIALIITTIKYLANI